MDDFFDIVPFSKKCAASILPPGSKSITNRALILSALCGREISLRGALFSRDTFIMADCLQKMGWEISLDEKTFSMKISASRKTPKFAEIFVGNAGTAARFVTALAALDSSVEYYFDSDEEMRRRPMKGLLQALSLQGAEFEFVDQKWSFPFRMKPNGLAGGDVVLDASESGQILSALLMTGAFARSPMRIRLSSETVSRPFIGMTLKMMKHFGICACEEGKFYSFEKFGDKNSNEENFSEYIVEPDASAASYFAMLPYATGGAAFIEGVNLDGLQGDAKFMKLLEEAGLVDLIECEGGVLVRGKNSEENSFGKMNFDFCDISDTFMTLAAVSPILPCEIAIRNVAHARAQESDRVFAMASQLKNLCEIVEEFDDGLRAKSFPKNVLAQKTPAISSIKTYSDHRIAMSFSVLGCFPLRGDAPWIRIENPSCVSKTWKEFFEVLGEARKSSQKFRIVAVDGGAAVGKSSVSRECASTLSYMHVDTGSHYRTLAYGLLERGISHKDVSCAGEILKNFKIGSVVENGSARMTIDGNLVEDSLIRSERINSNVSHFATMPEVRNFLKAYQQSMADFAKTKGFGGIIMEGRDIGSVIFPNADVKIFLDADESTRIARRAKEGISDSIGKRDTLDKTRKVAPLKCAQGAINIDTSNMSKREVVSRALVEILKS